MENMRLMGAESDVSHDTIPIAINEDTKTVRIENWVWDTDLLEQVRMTQPAGSAANDNLEKLLIGNYFLNSKYDYDSDGNCIYKGENTVLTAADGDTTWNITKYDYTSGNCTQKRFRVTSWTNRAVGW